MKKKLFLVLVIAFCLFINPTVYAANEMVAKVDGVEYGTLKEAIGNANGKTVTLLKNVVESITIDANSNITLDLAGFTLTNEASKHTITNNGTLTITGNGTVDNVSHGKGALVNKGTATLISGTLVRSMEKGDKPADQGGTNNGNSWYVVDNNGGTFTMIGGKILGTSGYSSAVRNLEATFNMEGGEITNPFIALKNDDNGTISMTGGTVSTTKKSGSAIQNWGTLEMTGGVLNAVEDSAAIYTLSWNDKYTKPTTTISNNAVVNGNIKISVDGNPTKLPEVTVNGGVINGNVTDVAGGKIEVTGGVVTGVVESTKNGVVDIAKADYSKIEALIEKYNALDKNNYKSESIEKVDAAIQVVEYDKTILEQSLVDGWANDIEEAINSLEKVDAVNPETSDGVLLFLGLSLIGIAGFGLTFKKLHN